MAIDLLKLITESNTKKWNSYLTLCRKTGNHSDLAKTYKGLQEGMNKLAKQNMSSERISVIFLRLQKSLENTAKEIFRDQHKEYILKPTTLEQINIKRKLDMEFQEWLKKARF